MSEKHICGWEKRLRECREGDLGKQPQAFPPRLLPSVTAPKNPTIWQAASAPEDESMSGTVSKQLIYARNKKK